MAAAVEREAAHGNPRAHDFPRTFLDDGRLEFSFSGLKTAVLYACHGQDVKRAAPPGPSRRRTAASASCTGTPRRRKARAAADLPMATEPVRPMMIMRVICSDYPPWLSSTKARNAGVTVGSTPNQAANAGRPWCNSMPRPSTATSPRARAALSSGVSSGT